MSAYFTGQASNGQTMDDAPLLEGVLFRRVCAWVIDLLLVGGIVAVLWVVLVGFGLLTLGLGLPLLGLLPGVPLDPVHRRAVADAGRGRGVAGRGLADHAAPDAA